MCHSCDKKAENQKAFDTLVSVVNDLYQMVLALRQDILEIKIEVKKSNKKMYGKV